MRKLERRTILVGGVSAAGMVGATAFLVLQSKEAAVLSVIRAQFGDEIADSSAAVEFTDAFVSRYLSDSTLRSTVKHLAIGYLPSDFLEGMSADDAFAKWVIKEFVLSTTAVRAYEVGADFVFVGLGSEHEIPCANTLSELWL